MNTSIVVRVCGDDDDRPPQLCRPARLTADTEARALEA